MMFRPSFTNQILAHQEILGLENRLMIMEGCLQKKGLKSKRLFETTCYASISQMFGGWCGRNSDVTYIPKWNGVYRLDYLTGFQGLNNLGWHRPDLKSLSHFRENSPYALPYSSTVLFKPPLFVATLSVTFSYQIYIDKISKQSQWMSWMLVPSETGCCQHYLRTNSQAAGSAGALDRLPVVGSRCGRRKVGKRCRLILILGFYLYLKMYRVLIYIYTDN